MRMGAGAFEPGEEVRDQTGDPGGGRCEVDDAATLGNANGARTLETIAGRHDQGGDADGVGYAASPAPRTFLINIMDKFLLKIS